MFDFPLPFAENVKVLVPKLSIRDDHDPSLFELVDQRLWRMRWSTCHNNLVKGSVFGPSLVPVPYADAHVLVTQTLEPFFR